MRTRAAATVVIAALSMLATACPVTTPGVVGSRSVNPCVPDVQTTCDTAAPNLVVQPRTASRGQLVVLLNGTGLSPQSEQRLAGVAADSGFHVISLRYSSDTGTSAACPSAAFGAECHRTFRAETVFGAGVPDPTGAAYDNPAVSVSGANSVVNRLLKLVAHLSATSGAEGWGSFLQSTGGVCDVEDPVYGACDLDWSKVVLVGHSLGAGVALYLAKFHDVARLALLSGPYDQYRDGPQIVVAPWITEGGFATPAADMAGLIHTGDPNLSGVVATWNQLSLPGPVRSVDAASPPYDGSQQLTTSVTPQCALDPNGPHNSTAVDSCVPTADRLTPAWKQLLGA